MDAIGEFWLTRLEDGTLLIDRAAPRVLISLDLIDDFFCGRWGPEASIRLLDSADFTKPGWLAGSTLRIDAANRTVIYRLVESRPDRFAWLAEWPD